MKRLIALAAALLLVQCAKPRPAVPAEQKKLVDDAQERMSLLDLTRGTAVVTRSGEALLEVSALRAIDGDPGSFWMTPPHELPQSMVVALPARSRIEQVGIRTVAGGGFTAKHVLFESSTEGRQFTPLTTITSADSNDAQWFSVTPSEATHLRVTMVNSPLPDHDVRLYSILARGAELEPPHPGDITGCWIVNGRNARFARRGARVIGILEMGRQPIRFDGGFDGRIYRLNWIRGNDYGMALISVAPDGQHLSGIEWHEEAIPMFFGDSWFGERQTCATSIADSGEVMAALLRRTGRFSLYSVDVQLLRRFIPEVRFVAHEFRQPTTERNREFSQRALDALRRQLERAGVNLNGVTFVAQGSDAPRQEPVTEAMRALYSSVDVEIRR